MRRPAIPLLALLLLCYPALCYLALARRGAREVALALLSLALLTLLVRYGSRGGRPRALPLLSLAPLGLIAGLTLASGEERLLLFLPVLVSLGLFALFADSLRPGRTSFVGRIARTQHGMEVLPAIADAYCRRVTVVWSAFFLVNALAAAALSALAPLRWWALYTGGIAYALVALLMALEWLYRVRRVEPLVRAELAELAASAMAAGEDGP